MQSYRESIVAKIARGDLNVPDGTERLEAVRWLKQVSKHGDRFSHYLGASYGHIGSETNINSEAPK